MSALRAFLDGFGEVWAGPRKPPQCAPITVVRLPHADRAKPAHTEDPTFCWCNPEVVQRGEGISFLRHRTFDN